MNESNSIKAIDKKNLANQTKFRLDEISKIENYFIEEVNQRKSCSEKLIKNTALFYYIDQALIILSAARGGVSIISFRSVVGTTTGTASASFTLIFSLATGWVNDLLNIRRNKNKKHDKMLCG